MRGQHTRRAEWERAGKCSTCGRDNPAATITDKEYRKEFEITGMCQRYQSEILRDGGAYYRAYLRAERDRPEYAERKRRRQQLTGF